MVSAVGVASAGTDLSSPYKSTVPRRVARCVAVAGCCDRIPGGWLPAGFHSPIADGVPYAGQARQDKYSGAAVVDNVVYFAPRNADSVGVFDPATLTFSAIPHFLYGTDKYWGAAAVGGIVYFVPRNQHNVGMLNTTSREFSTVSTGTSSTRHKYANAVVVGTSVYFVPYRANNVGVVDTTMSPPLFTYVTTTGVSHDEKYIGGATVGTKIFFSPFMATAVGVLDISSCVPGLLPYQ